MSSSKDRVEGVLVVCQRSLQQIQAGGLEFINNRAGESQEHEGQGTNVQNSAVGSEEWLAKINV